MTAPPPTDGAGVRRRWDGARWLLRAGIAATPVVATAVWPELGRDRVVALGLLAALWVPAISLTQRLVQRFPGAVPRLGALVLDLGALLLLHRFAPGLAPVLAVLTVIAAALHVRDLAGSHQLVGAVLMVGTQAAMLVGGDAGGTLPALVTLDVWAAAAVTQQRSEHVRDRRRSSAALDRASQLTDAVLTGIGEAVVVTDTTGRITSTNAAAEITFGVPVTGSCSAALELHEGAGRLDCSQGCPLLDPGTGVGQADVSRTHPGGSRQALLANVRGVRDPLGRVREVVHSYRDITAIKQAEQAKTLFLATASHELKTPLAVITGFVELLDNDHVPPERRRQAITTIRSRGDQLMQIIDRLLLASRIEGGGLTLHTQPTDLVAIVTDRVEALREVTGRTLELHLSTGPVPPVHGDATAVATIVDHLVENAVKYAPDGGPIAVALGVTEVTVELDVTDHGVGMTAAAAERCFEAFWQAESLDTRRFGGSGVGLYIVRSLARAMGGDASVAQSTPGQGTTFRVRLLRSDVAPTTRTTRSSSDSAVDDVLRQVGLGRD